MFSQDLTVLIYLGDMFNPRTFSGDLGLSEFVMLSLYINVNPRKSNIKFIEETNKEFFKHSPQIVLIW